MIVFFNKKTKEIIGQIEGRIHPPQVLAVEISIKGIKKSDIGKYIVPFKTKYTVPFAETIYLFEKNTSEIRKHKVKLKNGKVVGFERKEEK